MMQAVLRSQDHPERGQITVSLPIPDEEYDCVVEELAFLGIGDALQRDCRVSDLASEFPILKRLEDTNINLDELDYLAKRLDSFDVGEAAQFQANASLLIAAGTNLRTVSSRLGHSQSSTTANIYAHAIQSADEAAADTLNDILSAKKKKNA